MLYHQKLSLTVLTSTILLTTYQSANAQYSFPYAQPYQPVYQYQWMPDVCGGYSDSWSANCRRDRNGNIIDTKTGNVYNRNGNIIQRNTNTKHNSAIFNSRGKNK